MTGTQADKVKEISLGDVGAVVITVNNARFEVGANGVLRKTPANDVADKPEPGARKPRIGEWITGKGVFIGTKNLKDRAGESLGIFHLYAAPYDLGFDENGQGKRLVTTFNEAVKATAAVRNLLGHDGGDFENDTALHTAIRDGSYKGQWFIGTVDIVREDIYPNINKGFLKDRFATDGWSSAFNRYYSSCTGPRDGSSRLYAVDFTDGRVVCCDKNSSALSSRLVRAEPAGP